MPGTIFRLTQHQIVGCFLANAAGEGKHPEKEGGTHMAKEDPDQVAEHQCNQTYLPFRIRIHETRRNEMRQGGLGLVTAEIRRTGKRRDDTLHLRRGNPKKLARHSIQTGLDCWCHRFHTTPCPSAAAPASPQSSMPPKQRKICTTSCGGEQAMRWKKRRKGRAQDTSTREGRVRGKQTRATQKKDVQLTRR